MQTLGEVLADHIAEMRAEFMKGDFQAAQARLDGYRGRRREFEYMLRCLLGILGSYLGPRYLTVDMFAWSHEYQQQHDRHMGDVLKYRARAGKLPGIMAAIEDAVLEWKEARDLEWAKQHDQE